MREITLDVGQVEDLARRLHWGQTDKSGRPYIDHPARVAALVRDSGGDWTQVMAAWLHDSIEDTGTTGKDLTLLGVPSTVVILVETLTHPSGMSNKDYWERIAAWPRAVLVKQCDIYDNLDPRRMSYLNSETQQRLRLKYAKAMEAIS